MIWKEKFLLVLIVIYADQASKWMVERFLPLQVPVDILPIFSLFRTYNTGVAFSLLSFVDGWILVGISLIVIALVFWLWIKTDPSRLLTMIGFGLIVGGALGNLMDRIRLGHVVDFILLHVGEWSFAVFNLADSFISIGAGLIIFDEFRQFIAGFSQKSGNKP